MEQTIREILDFLKSSDVVKGMFSKYDIPLSYLDRIQVEFAPLDVSAKTKDCIIYINSGFLEDLEFSDDIHYMVHELCHVLQQMTRSKEELMSATSFDYLDMPTELEAFKCQIAFMKEFYDEDFAEDYVEQLLDFHEYEGEEREEKYKLLMGDE